MKELLIPFKTVTRRQRQIGTFIIFSMFLILWETSGNVYVPSLVNIGKAFVKLFSEGLLDDFLKSMIFCFKTILYSTITAYIIAVMSVFPVFSTFCSMLRKFRFLPSTGLSLLFIKMTDGVEGQMTAMMVFGITTYLVDSMVSVALSINHDEVNYAKSLRLSRWQMLREILIYGRSSEMFKAVISNFAMAWMLLSSVENIAKSSGGVGVFLADAAKNFKYDKIYAIQILILFTGMSIDFVLDTTRRWLLPFSKN